MIGQNNFYNKLNENVKKLAFLQQLSHWINKKLECKPVLSYLSSWSPSHAKKHCHQTNGSPWLGVLAHHCWGCSSLAGAACSCGSPPPSLGQQPGFQEKRIRFTLPNCARILVNNHNWTWFGHIFTKHMHMQSAFSSRVNSFNWLCSVLIIFC